MLNTPLISGKLSLRTRLVLPPMATQKSDSGGMPDDGLVSYYEAYARNPLIGLMITEHSYVDIQGKASSRQMSFAEDGVIPSQRRLVDACHAVNPDLTIFAQINHAGKNTSPEVTGQELVSASALSGKGGQARAMTREEIRSVERRFAEAARRVRQAGYDGVEIHAAHAYLLNQFYSPLTNKRTDEYGGALENRLRFLIETLRLTREAVGPDYPIAVRLGGCDYQPGGSTVQDAVTACAMLEAEGADHIDLSGGMCFYSRAGHDEAGWFSDMSAAVRQAVSVPILLTGGVTRPDEAETLLEAGTADLIGVGRALLRDPLWGVTSAMQ